MGRSYLGIFPVAAFRFCDVRIALEFVKPVAPVSTVTRFEMASTRRPPGALCRWSHADSCCDQTAFNARLRRSLTSVASVARSGLSTSANMTVGSMMSM